MADRVIAPVVIGAVLAVGALLTAALYYVALSFVPGGILLKLVVVCGGVAAVAAVAVVVRQRVQEIKEENSDEARAIATKRMVEEATELGADAVINLRYATSAVMQGAAEVLAYGTAVKFMP